MVRIWAKIMKDDKIVRDTIYTNNDKYDPANFRLYLTDICYILDIATPLLLKCHTKNFTKFNVSRFKASEFVDVVNFDALVFENAIE